MVGTFSDLSPHQIGELLSLVWLTTGTVLTAVAVAMSIATYRRALSAHGGGAVALKSVLKAKEWQRQTLAPVGLLMMINAYGSETVARLVTVPSIWDGVVTAILLATGAATARRLWRLRWQMNSSTRHT